MLKDFYKQPPSSGDAAPKPLGNTDNEIAIQSLKAFWLDRLLRLKSSFHIFISIIILYYFFGRESQERIFGVYAECKKLFQFWYKINSKNK